MVGDLSDIVGRLFAALPGRWFGNSGPNLNGLLSGIGTSWVWLFGRVTYAIQQTRLLTATEQWLDLIGSDYFGAGVVRKSGESDSAYRGRIQRALLCDAATRDGVLSGLEALSGTKATIFEPANCRDTGGYGTLSSALTSDSPGMAYGAAGGWGNLMLPLQFFITVTRGPTLGASGLAGYGTPGGGLGEGAISYIDLTVLPGQVTDQDIRDIVCSLLPINATAWIRIT